MGFIYVADGIDDVLAVHLDQYADAWSGVAGKGQPFNAVAVNDPINFAISARNLDPTNSRAAQFLKADGTVLFQCDASGVKVSPDGTVASVPVTATSTQTLTNKTLTAPSMTSPTVTSGTTTLNGILTVNTTGGNLAASGDIRLPNGRAIAWRWAGNAGDSALTFDANDKLAIQLPGSSVVATIGAAGAAAALVTPAAYLLTTVNGVAYRLALFN